MTVYKSRKIAASLLSKGFELIEGKHRNFFLIVDGKRSSVATHLSHDNRKEIGKYLIDKMRRQLRLTHSDFIDLIECPMTYSDLVSLLREKNVLR